MDIREEFDARVKRLESFIEDRGLGSKQLKKAKNAQKNVNAIILLGSLIVVAGIAVWALNSD
ncbi:MAG: hypothetical protein ACLFN2_06950 [Bacteroidales bacterium]